MTEPDRLPVDLADAPTMRPGRVCKIDGCETKHMARGLCQRHYKQWRRHNDPDYREAQRQRQRRRKARRRAEALAACPPDPGDRSGMPDLSTPNNPEEPE